MLAKRTAWWSSDYDLIMATILSMRVILCQYFWRNSFRAYGFIAPIAPAPNRRRVWVVAPVTRSRIAWSVNQLICDDGKVIFFKRLYYPRCYERATECLAPCSKVGTLRVWLKLGRFSYFNVLPICKIAQASLEHLKFPSTIVPRHGFDLFVRFDCFLSDWSILPTFWTAPQIANNGNQK